MSSAQADQIDAVANRLFTAIEQGDAAELCKLLSDDIVVCKTADQHTRDKVRALRVLDWLIGATDQRRYDVSDRRFFDGGFVQQHTLHAAAHDGATISMRACIVAKVNPEGRITRIDEYFDPADLSPLLRSTEQQRR